MTNDNKTQFQTVKSANGVSGHILYVHGANKSVFRVYGRNGDFIDHDILHCDLHVTIDDADATFYSLDSGRTVLDHCPETLGISDIEVAEPAKGKQTFTRAEFEEHCKLHEKSSQILDQIRSIVRSNASDNVLSAHVRRILDGK